MNLKTFRYLKPIGLGFIAFGFMAIMIPHECSLEESKELEQFQYITHQEGFKKPKRGEFTFYHTNGPVSGGSISALVHDGEAVYLGIFGDGVYRKKGTDDLWEPLGRGIKDPFVLSLKMSRNGILIAGTIKGGIFRSADNGKTWQASNTGLSNPEVTTIVEYKNEIFIGTGGGVFKSKDEGLTWIPLNKGMESMLVKAFLIDHSGIYFAGTGGKGIFKSTDKGKTWEHIEFKLEGESGLNENYIRVVAQSPSNNLFAGTFGGGIFRSTDGGKKWIPVNSGLTNTSIRTLLVTSNGTIITGTGEGIFSSSDDGKTWRSVNGDLADRNVQSMMVTTEHIYIGTASAVFRKPLNESHWDQLDKGITYPTVLSLTGDPVKGFYAGTDGEGVYRSNDGGFSWFPMNEGLTDMSVRTMVEDETHTLFILNDEGIYKGDRTKKSWIAMKEGIGDKRINALFLDEKNNLFSGTDGGLFKRDWTSNYWEKVDLPIEIPVKWIAGGPGKIFAMSGHDMFLIKQDEPNPFSVTFPQVQGDVRGVFFKENLYLWTGKAIFEGKMLSHDLLWRMIYEVPPGFNCQTVYVEKFRGKETLFAGTDKGGFWSDDQGGNWHKISGEGASLDIRSFFSPFQGTLLLGTGDHGVWIGIGL